MPQRLRSVIPHAAMLVLAVLLYLAAGRIDAPGSGGRLGPDAWPKFIIVVLGALCVYEIVKRLVVGTSFTVTGLVPQTNKDDAAEAVTATPDAPTDHHGKLFAGIALVAGYVLGVSSLGFFIGTAAFLAAFTWIGGWRRPLALAFISLAGAFVLLVVFMRVAYVSLPLGIGPFEAVSLALLKSIGA
jgi:putative tricarboxylic transport membrane protein